jgi:2'-5' RNA ligase
MRLFIALNLPKKDRERLHRGAGSLRDLELPVRWVEPDDFHVTMKFLGDVPDRRRADVEAVLTKVSRSTPALELTFEGFGAFPTIRRPRILWVGAVATPELRCLKQDLEWGLASVGFERETRAFHPHITLGRAQEEGGAGAFRGVDDHVAAMDFSHSVTVRTVDLMRSRLTKSGPRYTVERTMKLATDDADA